MKALGVARGFVCTVLVSAALAAAAGDSGSGSPKGEFRDVKARWQELHEADKPDQAVAVCEEFLKACPDTPPYSRNATVLINDTLSHKVTESSRRLAVFVGARERFAACPEYYCLGVAGVVRNQLFGAKDYAQSLAILDEALTTLGDKLAVDYYLGYNLLILKVQTLRGLGRLDEALALARESAARSPWMLGDRGFLRAVYDVARDLDSAALKADQLSPGHAGRAACLYYTLCDFQEVDVKEAVDLVAASLSAQSGPGVGLQFAKAQEDVKLTNPLREVKPLELADPQALVKAAGDDPAALINAHLYAGQVDLALRQSKRMLQSSSRPGSAVVAKALRSIARCFKAHDLSLVRANQFLEFHNSGVGENPLYALDAELKQAAAK